MAHQPASSKSTSVTEQVLFDALKERKTYEERLKNNGKDTVRYFQAKIKDREKEVLETIEGFIRHDLEEKSAIFVIKKLISRFGLDIAKIRTELVIEKL